MELSKLRRSQARAIYFWRLPVPQAEQRGYYYYTSTVLQNH